MEEWALQNIMTDEVYSGPLGLAMRGDPSAAVAPTFSPPSTIKDLYGAWAPAIDVAAKVWGVTSGSQSPKQAGKEFVYTNVVMGRNLMDFYSTFDAIYDHSGLVHDPITGEGQYKLESKWDLLKLLAGLPPLAKSRMILENAHTTALSKKVEAKKQAMDAENGVDTPANLDTSDPATIMFYKGRSAYMKKHFTEAEQRFLMNQPRILRPQAQRILQLRGFTGPGDGSEGSGFWSNP
jgi:hypothetical protein